MGGRWPDWLGPLDVQQFMVFVSGGYTQARFDAVNSTRSSAIAGRLFLQKNTYDGWFIGTGYEYGLGFLPGLFWKTEYRFADYGNENVRILTAAGVPRGDFARIAEARPHRAQRARVALQLRRPGGRALLIEAEHS